MFLLQWCLEAFPEKYRLNITSFMDLPRLWLHGKEDAKVSRLL